MAIIICALFFALVAGYSLHHARHWRILEEHYEAGKLYIVLVK